MRIGEVIKKEREKINKTVEEMAKAMDMPLEFYQSIEAGDTPMERWAPIHAWIAIKLEKPMSRFVAKSGKTKDAKKGQFGELLKARREEQKKSLEELAKAVREGAMDYAQQFPRPKDNFFLDENEVNAPKDRAEKLAKEIAALCDDFAKIEAGKSDMEKWAPIILACAEQIEQPVFNFIYPCSLPASSLDDYP